LLGKIAKDMVLTASEVNEKLTVLAKVTDTDLSPTGLPE
jgi:hypothetical protein